MLKKFSAIIAFLAIILFVALNINQEKIFILKANDCFKNNDIKCAQENFEKAFVLGYQKELARETYVNTIINSPLDLESQEKIIKFLSYDVNDSAKLKLDYFLQDLRIEVFKTYPANYVKQAVYNQKILRWGRNPITYDIVVDFNLPQKILDEIKSAFLEWENATDKLITFEMDKENPNIIFRLEENIPSEKVDAKFIVAYTTPEIDSNKLKNMEIKFYVKNPLGQILTNNQIYNTALHEIAHALGLMGHSNDKNNIMYMIKDTQAVSKNIRENLTNADINTIKLLYKIKPDITNSDENIGEYLPEIILGSDEEISSAKLEEAKRYIQNAPSIVAGYIDLAESYSANKEYSKSIKTLEHALKIADTDELVDIVCFNLALTYFNIDHMEMAKDYIYRSIAIENTDEKRFLLAEIFSKSGEISSAEREYKYLVKKNPKYIEYTIALTNLYVMNKNYIKARKVLSDFVKINPSEKKNPRFKPYGILRILL